MAKIIPSSLITGITGKINGDVFSMWRGIIVRRKGTKPSQPRTSAQVSVRQSWSYLSGTFDQLPPSYKTNWKDYAQLVSPSKTGFSMFMALNQVISSANYITLTRLFDAPPLRNPPYMPANFESAYSPGSDRFELSWTSPLFVNYYVQIFTSPVTGYRDTNYPKWKLHSTISADVGSAIVDASQFAWQTQIRFRGRTVNCYGETSGYTYTTTSIKTA
jgi:hypothetical protein